MAAFINLRHFSFIWEFFIIFEWCVQSLFSCCLSCLRSLYIPASINHHWYCNHVIKHQQASNSLLSAAFLIPDSSSGASGLRPIRSNLNTRRGDCLGKSKETITVLLVAIWEPIVVSRVTITFSVELKACLFHRANSPGGHHRLHVESDRDSWPEVRWGRETTLQ